MLASKSMQKNQETYYLIGQFAVMAAAISKTEMTPSGHVFPDRDNVGRSNKCNCLVKNVVYGIYCKKCKRIVYVGETSRTVGERLKEHMADVRLGRDRAVAHHFRGEGHDIEDIGFKVLELISDKSRYYR